jgi:C-terminal processing protease CtpA/Prc
VRSRVPYGLSGTTGLANRIMLPGGYGMFFTGQKVLKHDGTQHHGVGVRPTVPASRTVAGVAAQRDEVLERALKVLSAK